MDDNNFKTLRESLASRHYEDQNSQYNRLHSTVIELLCNSSILSTINDHQKDRLSHLVRLLHIDALQHQPIGFEVERAAVRLVDYCKKWRIATGALHRLTSIEDIPLELVESAVRFLAERGRSGFAILQFGNERFIQSAPMEFVNDDLVLMSSTGEGGKVERPEGWPVERHFRAIDGLLRKGLIWWDCVDDGYWMAAKFMC